jgi:hypothetical protein
MRKQATASRQLDIFFRENVCFVAGDTLLFLRLFLTTVSNLKLIYNIGERMILRKIRRPFWCDKTNSSIKHITSSSTSDRINMRRRATSPALVTVVR